MKTLEQQNTPKPIRTTADRAERSRGEPFGNCDPKPYRVPLGLFVRIATPIVTAWADSSEFTTNTVEVFPHQPNHWEPISSLRYRTQH